MNFMRNLLPIHSAHSKAEPEVLGHGHVRIQGVALEDHGHVPFPWGEVVHGFVVQQNVARVLRGKSCDDIEESALSATGRTEKHAKGPVFHVDVHLAQDADLSKALADVL